MLDMRLGAIKDFTRIASARVSFDKNLVSAILWSLVFKESWACCLVTLSRSSFFAEKQGSWDDIMAYDGNLQIGRSGVTNERPTGQWSSHQHRRWLHRCQGIFGGGYVNPQLWEKKGFLLGVYHDAWGKCLLPVLVSPIREKGGGKYFPKLKKIVWWKLREMVVTLYIKKYSSGLYGKKRSVNAIGGSKSNPVKLGGKRQGSEPHRLNQVRGRAPLR